ncbi:MAG TPA: helix-turn-helix transcriptional regulator [Baekduia sp.]|nr:helix-turn-helix transcriptional regulator [Baekduia sp.]
MIDGAAARRLRGARERRGLSQAELALAAEISRSQVSAIEQGRHVPAVDAALRLAAALATSVEELFGPGGDAPPPAAAGVLGPLAEGAAVRTARVGDALVAAPAGADPRSWAAADGVVQRGAVAPLPRGRRDGCVLAGCDPALTAVDELTAARGAARVVAVPAPTGAALRALAAGRCHGALVHGRAGHLPQPPVPVRRWRFARWPVGLAYAPQRGGTSLEALLADGPRIVRRPATATSDQAVLRAARRLGLPAPRRAVVAAGHLEAAQRAAWTGAPAVTYGPAAAAMGLAFAPLEDHVVELWVAEPWRDHPGVAAALDVVGSAVLRRRLEALDGYDLTGAGTALEAA